MNTSNNRVQLTGNLGKDPEIKNLDKGGKLAKFSMATRDYFINRAGEKSEDTQWHYVVAWGKLAEQVEADLKKGSFVSIEGKLVTRSYEDKEGKKRYVTEVVAQDVVLNNRAA